jgi:hypothetical protein
MCEACNQLDEKIEHAMTDQLTIERITALVAELEGKKSKLQSRSDPHISQSLPRWRGQDS